jgi:hypothetical protein
VSVLLGVFIVALALPLPVFIGGGLIKVVLKGSLFGQVTRNTFKYRSSVVLTNVDLAQAATRFRAVVLPDWKLAVSQDWSFTQLSVKNLLDNSVATYVEDVVPAEPGAVATDSDAPTVAVTIDRNTLFAGRHGRGHINVAGIAEAQTIGGQVDPATFAAWAALAVDLGNTLVTAAGKSLTPVLAYSDAPLILFPTWNGASIVNYTLNPILGSQRSRKIGRGE